VQAPIRPPLNEPGIIGPTTKGSTVLFAEIPPINCAGTVLSHPPIMTHASIGCALIISSVSIDMRLRRNMLVGEENDS
jgi:hypothetical protein